MTKKPCKIDYSHQEHGCDEFACEICKRIERINQVHDSWEAYIKELDLVKVLDSFTYKTDERKPNTLMWRKELIEMISESIKREILGGEG